jgi:GGDEF domain-containing protein
VATLSNIGVLLIMCAGFGLYAVTKGKNLSHKAGLLFVAAHGALSAGVLGFTHDYLRAVAVLQEMPLIAIYLAWFYPRGTARMTMFAYASVVVFVSIIGPSGYLKGFSTWHEVVRLVLFLALSMELGYLWRRRVDSDNQIDMLTGVLTRGGLNVHAQREIARANRYDTPLSFVVVDLDDFKDVNDTSGHTVGDRVLTQVAEELKTSVRTTDLVFRVGGDEFVLLLPHTSLEQASQLVNRLRSQASHPWYWGATQLRPGDTMESMSIRADHSMYRDKKRRRGDSQNGQ